MTAGAAVSWTLTTLALYGLGTLCFDVVHWWIHARATKSPRRLLRDTVGRAHLAHHLFYDRRLERHERHLAENALLALPLEAAAQALGAWAAWQAGLSRYDPTGTASPLGAVLLFVVVRSVVVAAMDGEDSHHVAHPDGLVNPTPMTAAAQVLGTTNPSYHALHHVYPDAYYGSFLRHLDWLLGTAHHWKDRRVVVTGASGAYGAAMKAALLEDAGVQSVTALKYGRDYGPDDYGGAVGALEGADILILVHGAFEGPVQANYITFRALTELFLRVRVAPGRRRNPAKKRRLGAAGRTLVPPEIWGLGSEAECHPAVGPDGFRAYVHSKRLWAAYARFRLVPDPAVVYRHIVPSAFRSGMGGGGAAVASAETVVSLTLWWLRRGATYVPASYTPFAYLVGFPRYFMGWQGRAMVTEGKEGDDAGLCVVDATYRAYLSRKQDEKSQAGLCIPGTDISCI